MTAPECINSAGLPRRPACSDADDRVMTFGYRDVAVAPLDNLPRLKVIDALYAARR